MKITESELKNYTMTDVNVLVKIDNVEEVTKGGILLPDSVRSNEVTSGTQGVLISHGASAFRDGNGNKWANAPQVGDAVFCAKYAGLKIETEEGENYRLMTDLDIKMFNSQGEE